MFIVCVQVDTYGVPRYQEANPAFLASITFPFLFGVMYGDIGHGGIVLLLGLYLMLFSDRLKRSGGMFAGFVPFRYLLALMGFFAFYAGFLYNDLFALGVDIFGSTWTEEGHEVINGGIRLKRIVSCSCDQRLFISLAVAELWYEAEKPSFRSFACG